MPNRPARDASELASTIDFDKIIRKTGSQCQALGSRKKNGVIRVA
ncbi:hypothetical protein OZD61_02760 [Wolbachia endosymbiont of Drosophila bocki]|nr:MULTISPECIES: hypothetical protein [unclassified Wolbachia]MDE5057705.1 hypothetical protein [Wolbachia endosymbiont of Drosophila bocki]MDE5067603.1 hypothetical protein [Wolbachia endosymbiont of Drosophila leontia]